MRKRAIFAVGGALTALSIWLCGALSTSASDNVEATSFPMGDAVLTISNDATVQLVRADGSEIGERCKGFGLRLEDGTTFFAKSFGRLEGAADNAYRAVFEDGSIATYRIERGNGFVLFHLDELETKSPVDEAFVVRVSIPDAPIAWWINTATLDDGFRVGVMTASINALPMEYRGSGEKADKKGCSHTFRKLSKSEIQDKDGPDDSPVAEFCATSTLGENAGWSVRGKDIRGGLDLSGCLKLRARVYGDGKGEALKVQLLGEQGVRDDYIYIDFEGWQTCELDAPALNDLSYDKVQRILFYYNSLPANDSVRCLIDRVEAVFDDNGSERVVVLEDFSGDALPYWDAEGEVLTAKTVARHKLCPASCAIVATKPENWNRSVQAMQVAAGIPSPVLDGGWRGESPWLHQSYFFLTYFKADEYESALEFAKRGGFKQILLLQNTWTSSTGHYRVNKDAFPGGVPQLRETIEKFNREGIRFGLHFLGASVDNNDPYLTPVPDKRFVTDVETRLVQDVSADPEPVALKTKDPGTIFPVGEDPYMGSGQIVRIDDELLEYAKTDESGLLECRRGVYGTKISEHKAGTKVVHFTRAYGYHLPDLDTDFIDEIASNFAELANQLPIDMIYFDGSELLQRPGEGSEHWYYNARLHKAFYDKLKNKNLLVQASSCSPFSWHMIARNASADGHDDLKAYLEERSGGFDPKHTSGSYLDVGWYYAYDRNSTPDMYEYCLGATIGYDASFSFQTGVSAAKSHPFIGEILDTIRAYEDLRMSHRFSDEFRKNFQFDPELFGRKSAEERAALIGKRKEYRLETLEDGSQAFRRVVYPVWENVGAGESILGGTTMNDAQKVGDDFVWTFQVGASGRVGLQVHFKDEGTPEEGAELVDPRVRLYKVDGDKEELVGELSASARLAKGQYVFALPDKTATVYGLPLTEPSVSSAATPDLRLEPGAYRAKFTAKSGLDLPIRVRVPLFTDELLPVPEN